MMSQKGNPVTLDREPLKAADVAAMLHIGKNAVYERAKSGELASYRIGRKLLFNRADVEAYATSLRYGGGAAAEEAEAAAHDADVLTGGAPAFAEGARRDGAFTILGTDIVSDIASNRMNAAGLASTHLYESDYQSLARLYFGSADIAFTQLYDHRSNACNVPFVEKLAPGASVCTIRIVPRTFGFVVAPGNPRRIASWGALLREGVTLANQRLGSAARILLDEKVISMDARAEPIEGYAHTCENDQAVAQEVAAGIADVGVVCERSVAFNPNVEFVPLQTVWLDATVAKTERTRALVRKLKSDAASNEFRALLRDLGEDVRQTGSIVYES